MMTPASNNKFFRGRGAQFNPHNRFQKHEYLKEFPEGIDLWEKDEVKTEYFEDYGRSIANKVSSPDIPIAYSVNPYQGCEHGCIYCYARNSHEYWGVSAGTDFESKIVIKKRAPELLRQLFSSKKWKAQPISLSGNTDCYQPAERKLQLTRELLKVCLDYQNPVGIITKNKLILRDLDLLQELASNNLLCVYTSITSVDEKLRRKLEPRTSTYKDRFEIIESLSKHNIPVGVMNAPIIPGLNDIHMYEVLRQAGLHGARYAGYTMVRLNGALGVLFADWLDKFFPDRKDKVLNLIRDAHGGQLNDSRFGKRMKGEGNLAEIISQQFKRYRKQFGFETNSFEYNTKDFKRLQAGQLRLF